ncbi:hypothetical protein JTB14_037357 [Gonioctena quinquepunctata]|nr:hypothetical protein JTB14_037357 [Gonioctena quinquepunctata]
MAESEHSLSDCSHSYKFCEKPLKYHVCVKCFSVFHQSCIIRKKNTNIFVSEDKVICCKNECETEENTTLSDNSTLEQTVRDLVEKSQWKCNYITKLKEEKTVLVNEALEMKSKLNEQEENKPEFDETPSLKIIQSVEQATQTRTVKKQNQLGNMEYRRCERKNGNRRVRQHKTINSFEVEIINDDHIHPNEKSTRKVVLQNTPETEPGEISQNSFGHQTLESVVEDNGVAVNQLTNEIGVNNIGHQTPESAVAEDEVVVNQITNGIGLNIIDDTMQTDSLKKIVILGALYKLLYGTEKTYWRKQVFSGRNNQTQNGIV